MKVPDPAAFLGYWMDEEATKARFIDQRFTTSDVARQDEHGYFRYVVRSDDVIKSAGHRISPGGIEEAAKRHPGVVRVAAIGIPDSVCGQAVKLFIQLKSGELPSGELHRSIYKMVRAQLPANEWPHEVEFESALPLTDSGKVARREFREGARGAMKT